MPWRCPPDAAAGKAVREAHAIQRYPSAHSGDPTYCRAGRRRHRRHRRLAPLQRRSPSGDHGCGCGSCLVSDCGFCCSYVAGSCSCCGCGSCCASHCGFGFGFGFGCGCGCDCGSCCASHFCCGCGSYLVAGFGRSCVCGSGSGSGSRCAHVLRRHPCRGWESDCGMANAVVVHRRHRHDCRLCCSQPPPWRAPPTDCSSPRWRRHLCHCRRVLTCRRRRRQHHDDQNDHAQLYHRRRPLRPPTSFLRGRHT